MAKSDYFENLTLNIVRGTNVTAPTAVYVGLASSATLDSHTGATVPELANSNGYARQSVTFGAPASGQIANTNSVNFTASANWAQATYFFIVDSATYGAGNVLYHGPLTQPITVLNGETRQFAIGAIVIGED